MYWFRPVTQADASFAGTILLAAVAEEQIIQISHL